MPTHRHWCATFFSEPKTDVKFRYMIVGKETCPTTGSQHWQSYIEFSEKISMKKIKLLFDDNKVHLETRMGEREQARDYCKKEGDWHEYGVWATGPGFRTDLVDVTKMIIEGKKKLTDIIVEEPALYCKYRNGLKDIAKLAEKKNSEEFRQVDVEFISGPTGSNKTRRAMAEPDKYKISGSDLAWFDDYDGEQTLIIDEYDNDVKITALLSLLDGYQKRLPIKGGFTYARWTKVIITTNLQRSELHPQAKPEHRNALDRRISRWTDLWDRVRGTAGNTELQYPRHRSPPGGGDRGDVSYIRSHSPVASLPVRSAHPLRRDTRVRALPNGDSISIIRPEEDNIQSSVMLPKKHYTPDYHGQLVNIRGRS